MSIWDRKIGEGIIAVTIVIVAAQIVTTYSFAQAWLAPLCKSASDVDFWCLPIGYEGPFGDVWANHSLLNTRLQGSIQFGIVTIVLLATLRWTFGQPSEARGIYAFLYILIALGTLIFPALFLNTVS